MDRRNSSLLFPGSVSFPFLPFFLIFGICMEIMLLDGNPFSRAKQNLRTRVEGITLFVRGCDAVGLRPNAVSSSEDFGAQMLLLGPAINK